MGVSLVLINIFFSNIVLILGDLLSLNYIISSTLCALFITFILVKHLSKISIFILIPLIFLIPLLSWAIVYSYENFEFLKAIFKQYGLFDFIYNYLIGLLVSNSIHGIYNLLILFVPIALINETILAKRLK